jgi:hypothetical protein
MRARMRDTNAAGGAFVSKAECYTSSSNTLTFSSSSGRAHRHASDGTAAPQRAQRGRAAAAGLGWAKRRRALVRRDVACTGALWARGTRWNGRRARLNAPARQQERQARN